MRPRLTRSVIVCGLLLTIVGCGLPSNVPPHEVIGTQAALRMVLVSTEVLADDEYLWAIADYLGRNERILRVMFWTDRLLTPSSMPMNPQQLESMRVLIGTNRNINLRELERQP